MDDCTGCNTINLTYNYIKTIAVKSIQMASHYMSIRSKQIEDCRVKVDQDIFQTFYGSCGYKTIKQLQIILKYI